MLMKYREPSSDLLADRQIAGNECPDDNDDDNDSDDLLSAGLLEIQKKLYELTDLCPQR